MSLRCWEGHNLIETLSTAESRSLNQHLAFSAAHQTSQMPSPKSRHQVTPSQSFQRSHSGVEEVHNNVSSVGKGEAYSNEESAGFHELSITDISAQIMRSYFRLQTVLVNRFADEQVKRYSRLIKLRRRECISQRAITPSDRGHVETLVKSITS